jgi:polysaccharide export outer membrane protein
MSVEISASVTERYVYVGGEVQKPGRIIWTPDLTAAKAIEAAGGFTLYAKEDRVGVVRNQVLYPIDIKLAQKDPAQDPRLEPGDSIQVSRSAF